MQIVLLIAMVLISCTSAQRKEINTGRSSNIKPEKTLIVYLSRTNNTKAVAEIIQQNVGGNLVALELETPYPEHYQTTVKQVAEENRIGFLPPLKTKIDNIQKYEVVFVGFPTWGMQLPPPVKSFLNQYDLSGKKVIPFNTNAGYGIGSSFQMVKKLCPNSEVSDGYTVKGGAERDGTLFVMEGEKEVEVHTQVMKWLHTIGLVK
ncbi:flavodoxin [Sphingobacterium sp. UBA6320]|jgi:flavodoxin|uniref:flavodoxin n=1 Tax=Sphingobacterium sp. UBA6320 TaxID=1947510 RepID=UPI0025EA7CDE|nr:flavodoxin [Sphingobacterium sp. UBA6320]